MGIIDYADPEERRHTQLLRQSSEVERSDDSGFVPSATHGRLPRFPSQPNEIFDIAKEDPSNTAFTSHQGLSSLTCMLVQPKIWPRMFQRAVNTLLTKIKRQVAL